MTDSNLSIMTTGNDIDTSTNVMTNDSMDIMTSNSQPLTRTIGKPKQDKDPNALKIASFRTKEGVWAEFSAKAESDGLTATDVLKAAMEQYICGEYNPRIITPINTTIRRTNNGLTRNDVLEIVNTAISTAISTEQLNDSIMTVISTLSLCSHDDVSKRIDDAIDNRVSPLIESATLELVKTSTVEELVKVDIEPLTNSIVELEICTQSQFKAVRDELKKSLDRAVTTEPIAIATTPTPSKKKADGDGKTWCGFFEMVGIEAMTALEAQKKQYTNTRAEQTERGIQAAREQGLGEWIVKRAGRSFVRVGD